MNEIRFRVYGTPRPSGSKKGFVNPKTGGVIIVDASGKHSKTWKADVKDAALAVAPETLLNEGLSVSVIFYMPRPKAHYYTGKRAGQLRPDAPYWHTKIPDALKLMRGTEDALTGIIWKDDAIICDERQRKVYDERPGALITIKGVDDDEQSN